MTAESLEELPDAPVAGLSYMMRPASRGESIQHHVSEAVSKISSNESERRVRESSESERQALGERHFKSDSFGKLAQAGLADQVHLHPTQLGVVCLCLWF